MAITTNFKPRRIVSTQESGYKTDENSFINSPAIALDGARRRPHYFDGRFLTGKDLSRDQDYIRQRQDDLARASGTGVIAGLNVTKMDNSNELQITEGFGVTASGDLVVISNTLNNISLSNVADISKLDASFGLRSQPASSTSMRTGLFILALRPVEFTDNPTSAYPTSIIGQRHVENGDIVEATAVTLIPYPMNSSSNNLRAAAARQIFLEGSTTGLPVEALPLAMISLNYGGIEWVDVNMVRRENRESLSLQSIFGGRPRALAEAHIMQYQEQLQSMNGAAFAAATKFSILPPVGQLPLACLSHDGFGFEESFFPSGLSVEVSFIPVDEIAALVEESLVMAPIDLSAGPAEQAGTGVVILLPLQRADVSPALQSFGTSQTKVALPAPSGTQLLENLRALNIIREPTPRGTADVLAPAWKKLQDTAQTQSKGLVWYARRRSVAYRSSLEGSATL